MSRRCAAALLLAGSVGGCSFDVDRFTPALSGDDADPQDTAHDAAGDSTSSDSTSVDSGAVDSGAVDSGAVDSGAVDSGIATDSGGDGGCSSGTRDACFACCAAAFPKGAKAVSDVASACLCAACATPCSKTYCKPGAKKAPDLTCADCLAPATTTSCALEIGDAGTVEPQASSFGACVSACK